MKIKNDLAIVVGGGIVGIFSAIFLKERFQKVLLLESQSSLGGLLKSIDYGNGVFFDYGTHIPMKTGNHNVDKILFDHLQKEDWNEFEVLSPASFFRGKLNIDSVYPRADFLPFDLYTKGLYELLSSVESNLETNNLYDYLKRIYGETFAVEIYEPVMKKLTAKNTLELDIKTFNLFDIRRLILSNDSSNQMTDQLKESEIYDSKIAYQSYKTKQSKTIKLYPKENGVQLWIDSLLKIAQNNGVDILTSANIEAIELVGNKLDYMQVEGRKYKLDFLVWTAPKVAFEKLTGNKFIREKSIEFRHTFLYNITFEESFLLDNHYLVCLDSNYKTFRVTLYPNLKNQKSTIEGFSCTVEVFVDNLSDSINELEIINELVSMKVVGKHNKVLLCKKEIIKNSFPIFPEKDLKSDSISILDSSVEKKEFENVLFLGKSSGEKFFMNDVLINAYEELNKLFMERNI